MLNPVLNVVVYEIVREKMWDGEWFTTDEIVETVPAKHFFDQVNEDYDEDVVRQMVNKTAYDLMDEFDYLFGEDEDYDEDENMSYQPNCEDDDEDSENYDDCDGVLPEDEEVDEDNDGWEEVERLADSRGRITIPKKFLKEMGWEDGEDIYMGVYGSEVTIALNESDLEDARDIYTLSPNSNGGFQVVFNKLFDDVPDVCLRTLLVDYDDENNLIHIFAKND